MFPNYRYNLNLNRDTNEHKKKSNNTVQYTIVIFLGGAECEDQCDRCQSAIDHMAEKIESQFCNPNTMQKAWDGIREECDHFDSAVGLMAESCATGFLKVPGCGVPGTNLKSAGIYLKLTTSYLDFDFDIILQFSSDTFHFGSNDLAETETNGFYNRLFLLDVNIVEGEVVEVIVMNVAEDEEIGRESVDFSFARNSYWSSTREIEVSSPDQNNQEADVIFTSW